MRYLFLVLTVFASGNLSAADTTAVASLLKQYQAETTIKFNAQVGSELWRKKFKSPGTKNMRSCSSCHTSNLTVIGTHIKTKKPIDALAPSINNKRLTEIKTIKKWLKRNCKWTFGRICTSEEKGHLLTFIQSQ